MKKMFKYAAAALMAVATLAGFTACGGEDEPEPPVDENPITGYRVRYTVDPGSDLLNIADVTLAYTSETFGTTKTSITAGHTEVVTDYPASAKGKEIMGEVFIAPKAGFTPDPEEKYTVGAKILIEVWTLYKKGEPSYMSTVIPQGAKMTIRGDQYTQYMEHYADKHVTFQSFQL